MVLMCLSLGRIGLLYENFSHIAVTVPGYLYVLFLGILVSISTFIALRRHFSLKWTVVSSLPFLIASLIPNNNDPATLLASVHLFFAYLGTGLSVMTSVRNIESLKDPEEKKKVLNIYSVFLLAALGSYLIFLCINTLSELLFTAAVLLLNTYFFFLKEGNTEPVIFLIRK